MIKNKKIKILFLGPPGSGKGTIADLVSEKLKYVTISTGDLFRKTKDQTDPLSIEIQKIMNSGILISDEITNKLAEKAIKETIENDVGLILDGYPRTVNQAEYLKNIINVDLVVSFIIDNSVLIKRIVGRQNCLKCKKSFNKFFMPTIKEDICDYCQSSLSSRLDDKEDVVAARISEYNKNTAPLLEYYEKVIFEINAENSVHSIVKEILEKINEFN
jgi:adenylate kinase